MRITIVIKMKRRDEHRRGAIADKATCSVTKKFPVAPNDPRQDPRRNDILFTQTLPF
jgi:hypothetical protein